MVFAGQRGDEFAVAAAGRGPGRGGDEARAGFAPVASGSGVGRAGVEPVAAAAEPAGTGGVFAGDGAADEPAGGFAFAFVPLRRVAAHGGRDAAVDHGPDGARRGVPWHGAPSGGGVRAVPAAAVDPGGPVSRPPGVRGAVLALHHADGGQKVVSPHRLRGLGEPFDGAPVRFAGGAGGGDRPAGGATPGRGGAGGHRGGAGDGANGAGRIARARVRGAIAPASGGVSGAAPRGGAP